MSGDFDSSVYIQDLEVSFTSKNGCSLKNELGQKPRVFFILDTVVVIRFHRCLKQTESGLVYHFIACLLYRQLISLTRSYFSDMVSNPII